MNIGIVGLGVVGSSLGLGLRRLGHQVIGVSRREQTCQDAIRYGVVDRVDTNLALLTDADVIFICTPLDAILPTVQRLIPQLDPSTILTDVGSVKTYIVKTITSLWSNFVGGHPIITTSVTQRGIAAAQPHFFREMTYVLTPLENTPTIAVNTVAKILCSLECQVDYYSPEVHDRAIALFSHLPLVASYTSIATYLNENEPNKTIKQTCQKLMSSQFHDLLDKQNYYLEENKYFRQFNHAELLQLLRENLYNLDRIIELVEQDKWCELEQILMLTKQEYS
ncbi:MAG: prephenate dehydrogenase/arogenate dehydrogenase family protein [Brasilonema angustatum HA4187-MV1]|jgi:arogenate dehydrogenase (NADP+)|nr:prephenate dehydrogenase/arogenate dehydrogenase family protein [Brasilonema angustatum HA4187-MV1]